MNHQDFDVVNVGHGGGNRSKREKLLVSQRNGNTKSINRIHNENSFKNTLDNNTEGMVINKINGKPIQTLRIKAGFNSQKEFSMFINKPLNVIRDLESGKLIENNENKKLLNIIKQKLAKYGKEV